MLHCEGTRLIGAPRTYDCIVVGGGSAGSILAARLSERADHSVLMLEAGGWDRHWHLRVPCGAALRTGVQLARDIARQPAFGTILGKESMPGAAVSSDAEIDAYIRGTAATLFHLRGTCRMGADPSSVVDEHLRFREIEGLRLADASVMPAVVGGNINACVMMIAEKAAELIATT